VLFSGKELYRRALVAQDKERDRDAVDGDAPQQADSEPASPSLDARKSTMVAARILEQESKGPEDDPLG
jgi:hypothetical protein